MFSELISELTSRAELIGRLPPVDQDRTRYLLEKCVQGDRLSTKEIIELMNGTREERNRELILEFSAGYRKARRREILLLPPLYFSSICENYCLYCDFSRNGGHCLSPDEFMEEFDALLALGYRSIELVSSQDPELYLRRETLSPDDQQYNIERVLTYFKEAKGRLEKCGGGMLTSNIPPVDGRSFKQLRGIGLDCYLSWVETFNPGQYARFHSPPGPKSSQAFRLDAFERAVEAGIPHLSAAFLKGLYDWRKEEAVLYCFDRYLKEKNGHGFSIIGTPRLKGDFNADTLIRPHVVSDEDYELNLALDRILFDGINWLQTREHYLFNKKLIDRYGAGIILTIDCSTAPGGYKNPPKAKAQFPVFRRRLKKTVSELEKDGYRVIFDWDSETLCEFQRKH